jgi:hypothetical protein
LIYCPGSHAWPIYTNEHIGKNSRFLDNVYGYYESYAKLWDSLIEVHGARLERFCPRRGQALIWTANLLHGGDPVRELNRTRWSQVTHYYFDGCSYYTPLGSDPFFGQILFRDLVDISSRQPVPNLVSGHRVARQFIDAVAPKFDINQLPGGVEPEWQDAALSAHDAACADRDAALAARDAAWAERDALLRSTSWRITAPLRALSSAVRRR